MQLVTKKQALKSILVLVKFYSYLSNRLIAKNAYFCFFSEIVRVLIGPRPEDVGQGAVTVFNQSSRPMLIIINTLKVIYS